MDNHWNRRAQGCKIMAEAKVIALQHGEEICSISLYIEECMRVLAFSGPRLFVMGFYLCPALVNACSHVLTGLLLVATDSVIDIQGTRRA